MLSLLVVALVLSGSLPAQRLPRADTVVKPAVYSSLEPVPRGRTFELAVVAQIQEGFHVNANKVLEDYLIPTTLTPELPAGIKLLETKYPDGQQMKFEFSEQPLNVYEGTFAMRLKLEAAKDAPLGALKVPILLRYQACNDVACLPPVKKPLEAEVIIAPAGAKAVPVNQKIFSAKQ
ncbi:MAG: protein-disulfide reductase DsbD domain-containing protein [Candidatus Acidiferrales bacterium]